MNIRVYKVIFQDKGKESFEMKKKDERGSIGYANIEAVAEDVKYTADKHLKENFKSKVSIDFFPFHEIECYSGLVVRHCIPLSEEEKKGFLIHFNK